MKRRLTTEELVERRLRESVGILLAQVEKNGGPPELFDKLLLLLKEIRTPQLSKLGELVNQFNTRLEEVENTVRSLITASGGRVRTVPAAMTPNRLGIQP